MDNNAVSFEENYIFRNNRSITSNNDIALTEFVANAWDAGAHNVDITIPFEEHEKIVVEDDGTGMTDEEFRSRWMTLNYDRQKRQGKDVLFPEDVEKNCIRTKRCRPPWDAMLCRQLYRRNMERW